MRKLSSADWYYFAFGSNVICDVRWCNLELIWTSRGRLLRTFLEVSSSSLERVVWTKVCAAAFARDDTIFGNFCKLSRSRPHPRDGLSQAVNVARKRMCVCVGLSCMCLYVRGEYGAKFWDEFPGICFVKSIENGKRKVRMIKLIKLRNRVTGG